MGRILSMAESMRFELTVAFTTPPFQDGALNRSANSPRLPLLFYLFSRKCQQQIVYFSLFFCLFKAAVRPFYYKYSFDKEKNTVWQ